MGNVLAHPNLLSQGSGTVTRRSHTALCCCSGACAWTRSGRTLDLCHCKHLASGHCLENPCDCHESNDEHYGVQQETSNKSCECICVRSSKERCSCKETFDDTTALLHLFQRTKRVFRRPSAFKEDTTPLDKE